MDGESESPLSRSDVGLIVEEGHFFWLLFGQQRKVTRPPQADGRFGCCLDGNNDMTPIFRWEDDFAVGQSWCSCIRYRSINRSMSAW